MIFKRDKFKQIRKQKRWSISSLAEKTGISRTSISMWENGHLLPSEKMIRQLSEFLDIRISDISNLNDNIPIDGESLNSYKDSWFSLAELDEDAQKNKIGNLLGGIVSLDKQLWQASTVINAITSSMHSIFYVKDTDQKYIIANKAFLRILAKSDKYRIIGKSDNDLFSAKDAECNTFQDNKVMMSGKSIIDVEGFIPGTRKKRWGLISKIPILDRKGKVNGIAGVIVDITDRRKEEQKRVALNEAINYLDECVWVAKINDLEKNKYKVVYINDAIEKMTGIPKKEFINNLDLWINFVHPDFKEKIKTIRDTNVFPRHYLYKAIRQNTGEEYWRSDVTYKIGDMFFGIARDISDKKNELDELLNINNINIAKELIKNGVPKDIVLKSINVNNNEIE
jgi:PAS domain S-box-containing protein